jgi:hypothetical protein
MSAPRWEFYCTLDAAPDLRWGWRVRGDGARLDQSVKRFGSFMECHRDALQHGFAGSLEFGPSAPDGTTPPASTYRTRRGERGPGSGAAGD